MFFFNSFESKMKKAYASLNPMAKETVFSNGEAEFIFVTSAMRGIFKGRELLALIPIYASIYTFSILETGNNYGIKNYATKKMIGYDEEEIYSMMALVTLARMPKKNFETNLLEQIEMLKNGIKSEMNIQLQIKDHPDIFNTKDTDDVGTFNNPILVPGLSGATKYISKLLTESGEEIEAERTGCMYVTEPNTNINYAVDEFTVKNKSTKDIIGKLSFNEYGIETCQLCPKGFKFKN